MSYNKYTKYGKRYFDETYKFETSNDIQIKSLQARAYSYSDEYKFRKQIQERSIEEERIQYERYIAESLLADARVVDRGVFSEPDIQTSAKEHDDTLYTGKAVLDYLDTLKISPEVKEDVHQEGAVKEFIFDPKELDI